MRLSGNEKLAEKVALSEPFLEDNSNAGMSPSVKPEALELQSSVVLEDTPLSHSMSFSRKVLPHILHFLFSTYVGFNCTDFQKAKDTAFSYSASEVVFHFGNSTFLLGIAIDALVAAAAFECMGFRRSSFVSALCLIVFNLLQFFFHRFVVFAVIFQLLSGIFSGQLLFNCAASTFELHATELSIGGTVFWLGGFVAGFGGGSLFGSAIGGNSRPLNWIYLLKLVWMLLVAVLLPMSYETSSSFTRFSVASSANINKLIQRARHNLTQAKFFFTNCRDFEILTIGYVLFFPLLCLMQIGIQTAMLRLYNKSRISPMAACCFLAIGALFAWALFLLDSVQGRMFHNRLGSLRNHLLPIGTTIYFFSMLWYGFTNTNLAITSIPPVPSMFVGLGVIFIWSDKLQYLNENYGSACYSAFGFLQAFQFFVGFLITFIAPVAVDLIGCPVIGMVSWLLSIPVGVSSLALQRFRYLGA
ncbi:hypothetical protein SJAG_01947 [Schizosaccharomyces japonicus yFS275]|uniref:Uncharacterized protein n=1 Tax=Schizosaccharomyces japonicus (strain yFS275 / FY16936) TaxID=402676 RepID=B6JZB8_SCHJY|nr:hypothetical protein SJAG_01947 [Schizosaccharomyces japonicus yFS275]EEB06886.1 hypothetical protein SJAG_01947 [Schizosaccharomyces japonicus yFS275]